jgi:hypothetical protein
VSFCGMVSVMARVVTKTRWELRSRGPCVPVFRRAISHETRYR